MFEAEKKSERNSAIWEAFEKLLVKISVTFHHGNGPEKENKTLETDSLFTQHSTARNNNSS